MKFKSILLIGFLLVSASFAGCGGSNLEDPTSREYETLNGEFMSLGSVKVDKMVTHLFETDDGDILYAYSDRYDLDDEEYFGLRVEAYGVVMEYDSLDKDLFEVRRISEADEIDEEDENVEDVDYKDTDLGISFTYPDNWELTALRDGIQLEAPVPKVESDEEDVESDVMAEELQPDYMIISSVGEVLTTDTEDEQADRAEDIKSYVASNYGTFSGVTAESAYVGEDRQFAVKYRTEAGEISYFVARHSELLELSFFHPEEEDLDKLKNSNIFSEIVNSFRFIPDGDEEIIEETAEDVDEDVDDTTEDTTADTTEPDVPMSNAIIPAVDGSDEYREFESNPYKFAISYPSRWYYSGGNGGYDFADEPIEDDTEAIIRLDLNIKTSEGATTSGSDVSVTVLVGDRYYTLTGPSEYKNVMQYMADSIREIETE